LLPGGLRTGAIDWYRRRNSAVRQRLLRWLYEPRVTASIELVDATRNFISDLTEYPSPEHFNSFSKIEQVLNRNSLLLIFPI
jgi:hypothetical protein